MMPTRREILTMPSGYEIRKLLGHHVMGWNLHGKYWVKTEAGISTAIQIVSIWKPDEDILGAWQILEKFWSAEVNKYLNGEEWRAYVVCLSNDENTNSDGVAFAKTAPLAICRAALLAVQSASPTHDLP